MSLLYLIHWRPSNMRLREMIYCIVVYYFCLFCFIWFQCRGSIYYGRYERTRGVLGTYVYGQQLIRKYTSVQVCGSSSAAGWIFSIRWPDKERWLNEVDGCSCGRKNRVRYRVDISTPETRVCVYIDTIRGWNRVPPPTSLLNNCRGACRAVI